MTLHILARHKLSPCAFLPIVAALVLGGCATARQGGDQTEGQQQFSLWTRTALKAELRRDCLLLYS